MRLGKCCCCVSLRHGTIAFGLAFALSDLYLGSLGIYYVASNDIPKGLMTFFDKMNVRNCIIWFSIGFYIMACADLVLVNGAWLKQPMLIGIWLIINFIVIIFTVASALLNVIALLRLGALVYAMLVVSSFYNELTSSL